MSRSIRPFARRHLASLSVAVGAGVGALVAALRRANARAASAERARSAAAERLRLFVEHAPAAIAMFDSEMRYMAASRRYAVDYRLEGVALAGRSHYEVFPEMPPWWRAVHQRCLAGAVERCDAEPFVRADGSVDLVRWEIHPWRDDEGRVGGLFLFSEVVTARVNAERARRTAEDQLATLVASVPGVLSSVSQRAEGDLALTFAAQGTRELFGFTSDELARDRALWASRVHPDDLAKIHLALDAGLRDLSRSHTLYRYEHPTEGSRWIESWQVPQRGPDGVVWFGYQIDVTEHQRLNERYQQAQRLESVGRLAGGVAHDFNNLLTVILCCAESIDDDIARGAAADLDDVRQIRAAGERARDLTRQLLAFARKQVTAPVALDLNEALQRTQRMLSRLLGEDVALRAELQPDLWPVYCDPGQVEQVIMNLAVNARDAMPRGGVLTLATRNASEPEGDRDVPDPDVGDWVQLVVRDTGTGMSAAVREHLFEPFFTTKEQGKGTGLGLATVYGIVKQSGGHIHVESEEGRGATFILCFPRLVREVAPASQRAPAAARGGTETILVAEDEVAVRTVIARVLHAAGYTVVLAASGDEALALVERAATPIDLVLTDVVMPGLDGLALADAVARVRPNLPVVFMSGYADEALDEREVRARSVTILPKPFTPALLLERVRQGLQPS